MIKKISAIVLALVLCLTVVVMPASAADLELGDANVAFSLKWDKEYYSAGETAYLSVYMDAADDLALYTGSFLIGLNSSVFSQADNPIDDVKANAVTSDLFASYWKPADTQLSWLASSIATRVNTANTTEEQALYDHYLKYTAAKNASGSHANALNNKDGFYGSEFDPTEPIVTIALVVSADVADGTAVNAAITSGSLTSTPAQTAWKYYSNPGNATTSANVAASTFDVSQAVATNAQIGEPAAPSVPLTVSYWKDQIRFDTNANTGAYAGTFDYRILATIDNFDEVYADVEAGKASIQDVGFVFNRTAALVEADAKAQVEGGTVKYSTVSNVSVSTSYQGETYVMSCLVNNIPDADKGTILSAMAYVEYVQDGVTKYAYSAVQTSTFEDLYSTYYSQAFPA